MPPARRRSGGPLSGRVALVTGGAQRIGRATVLALADAGADVVVHANRSRTEAEALARSLRRRGRRAAVVTGDLADPAACERLVPEAVAALRRLDVLVNNAAVFAPTPADAPDAAAFDAHVAVNARAVYLLTGAAARWMARHGGGSVVNLACASALSAWPGYVPYSASKAAVVAVTQGFAKAFAPKVRVNAVAPGPILRAVGSSEDRNRAAVAATLLRRWGRAEDVAQAVVYLATAPFVTGTVLPVDGGRHLR
jgi:pteridine reductase